MADIRDTGDGATQRDNGGFGVEGAPRRTVGINRHPKKHIPLGAPELPESELVNAVLERFAAEPYDCRYVEVNRAGRKIVLFGTVESEDALQILEIAAAGVPGVVEVENELIVDPAVLKLP